MVKSRVNRPLWKLQRVCFNCKFYKRKTPGIFLRFGFCAVILNMDPKIKAMPKNKRKLYFDLTPADGICEYHIFKGMTISTVKRAVGLLPE